MNDWFYEKINKIDKFIAKRTNRKKMLKLIKLDIKVETVPQPFRKFRQL